MANYKLTNDYWETSGVYDITQGKTQREINADLKKYAGSVAETETATGDIATFDGVEDVPLKNLTVNIEPVQDLHGQEYPFPAGSTKNLFNDDWFIGGDNHAIDNEGNITDNSSYRYTPNLFEISPSTTYTAQMNKLNTDTYGIIVALYDTNGDFIERQVQTAPGTGVISKTFTTSSSTKYARIAAPKSTVVNNIQLELGSSATSYIPYSNICPITGFTGANVTRTGKNILKLTLARIKSLNLSGTWDGNAYTRNGIVFTVLTNSNGEVTGINVNGTASTSTYFELDSASKTPYPFSSVKINGAPIGSSVQTACLSDSYSGKFNIANGNDYSLNIPTSTSVKLSIKVASNAQISNMVFYPMVRDASIADNTFVPYQGETYNITFPSEAGTVYGGTLDVTNGVLTVTHQKVSLDGNVTFTKSGTYENTYYSSSNIYYNLGKAGSLSGCSSHYKFFGIKSSPDGMEDKSIASHLTYKNVYIKDSTFANASELDYYIAQQASSGTPVEFVYMLNTPITYTLTPTEVKALLGQNNVWADCGDVDVEYGAYLTVVENQLGEKIPKIAVAPIEKTTTASKAYSVNELFFMGDKLYIATASIAFGATFTVGTNCDETTLGEQITALLNA